MADALKRIYIAKTDGFQDRCRWYMYQKAAAIFDQETPDPDDLLLAKAVWSNQVMSEDLAMIVLTNSTIGGVVDNGNVVLEGDIEYVIMTDTAFHDLAVSYKADGLIGV